MRVFPLLDLLRLAVGQGIRWFAPSGTRSRWSLKTSSPQGPSLEEEESTEPLVAETGYKW